MVNVNIKTSASDKLDVKPRDLKLDSQKSTSVEITLRLSKPFGERFGTKIPIKEFIFVKTENFDQKIDVLILPDNTKPLPSKYLSNSSCENKAESQDNLISNEEFETLISAEPSKQPEYNSNQTNYDASKEDPSNVYGDDEEKIINSDIKSENMHSHHSSYPNHELIQHCLALEQQLTMYKSQADYLTQVKQILVEKEPDLEKLVSLAVDQEKAKSQQKYAKAVEIIRSKDAIIQNLSNLKSKYEKESTSLSLKIQQFEEYKQDSLEEIAKLRNLFKLNNEGKDIQHIQEYKNEIERLTQELVEKNSETTNYQIIVNNYEEKQQILNHNYERIQDELQQRYDEIDGYKDQIDALNHINEQQKLKIDNLVEKVNSLVDDVKRNCDEKSNKIQKEESLIDRISQLTQALDEVKNERDQIQNEHDSMKEVYFSFLETCHNSVNSDIQITDDFDIEFIQNSILNKLREMQSNIEDYEASHRDDAEMITDLKSQIRHLNDSLYNSNDRKRSHRFIQTETYDSKPNLGHAKSTTSLTYSEDDEGGFSRTGSQKLIKIAYQHDPNINFIDNQENISKNTMKSNKFGTGNEFEPLSSINTDEYVSVQKYNSLKSQNNKILNEFENIRTQNEELVNKINEIQSQTKDNRKIESLTEIISTQKQQIEQLQENLEKVTQQNNQLQKQGYTDEFNMFNNDLLQSHLT